MDPLNLICANIIFPSLVSARFFPRQFSPALYYLIAWDRLNVGGFSWSWIFKDFIQLQKEKEKFVDVVHGLVALGAFTSKSCVGRDTRAEQLFCSLKQLFFDAVVVVGRVPNCIVSPPRLECRYIEMGIPLECSWVENLFSDCMTDHLFLKGSADYCL